jgi:hypothetical protein
LFPKQKKSCLLNEIRENLSYFKREFFKLVTNIYFLSLIVSYLLIFFALPKQNRHKVIQDLREERTSKREIIFYSDLDNDNISEKILIEKTNAIGVGVRVSTKGKILDQWNFNGEFVPFLDYEKSVGDIDNDGLSEIFVFTIIKDSIYLSCFNPLKNKMYILLKPISDYYKINGKIDCSISDLQLIDISNNGYKEIYFVVNTGFSHYPREVYAYDYKRDKLTKTNFGGMGVSKLVYITKNNKSIFFVSNWAVGNCETKEGYSDFYTWFVGLDYRLKFLFTPKKIAPYPARFQPYFFKGKDNKYYIISLSVCNNTKFANSSLIEFKLNGKIIKRKILGHPGNIPGNIYINDNNDSYLIFHNGTIEKFDSNLNFIRKIKIKNISLADSYNIYDLDNDNKKEIILNNFMGNSFIVANSNLSEFNRVYLPYEEEIEYFSLVKRRKRNKLFIRGKRFNYYYSYILNNNYYFQYLYWLGIYLGFVLFFHGLQTVQNKKATAKYNTEKKIVELQIKNIENQVDSHFTLNMINSIGALFLNNKADEANLLLGKYGKMLRYTLLNSDKISIPLSEELKFVENYLTLQQFRIKTGFNYNIKIDNSVDVNYKIPKMLIYTFVENSVKHGIRHSKKRGVILISIQKSSGYLMVNIKDNGIGIKKSKKINVISTGEGLKILNEILELYEGLTKTKQIKYKIIDLGNGENGETGTEVKIFIPIE